MVPPSFSGPAGPKVRDVTAVSGPEDTSLLSEPQLALLLGRVLTAQEAAGSSHHCTEPSSPPCICPAEQDPSLPHPLWAPALPTALPSQHACCFLPPSHCSCCSLYLEGLLWEGRNLIPQSSDFAWRGAFRVPLAFLTPHSLIWGGGLKNTQGTFSDPPHSIGRARSL